MDLKHNFNLKSYNTFGINASCDSFAEVNNEDQFRRLIEDNQLKKQPFLILGGGSNLLFTQDFKGLIILNNIKGIEVTNEDDENIWVKVGAGENWHEFVLYAIEKNWGGIENLSLIPGSVGASPMQNIGAYGVEIKDVFYELEAINITTGEIDYFSNSDCKFGYRESVFKNIHKNQYLISRVTYQLKKKNHKLNSSYGAIESELEKMKVHSPTIQDISKAVIAIRTSKLPNPKEIGNAGSFFKNPIIPNQHFETLKKSFPKIVSYPIDESNVKIAAGWLIDQLGWKGKTIGNYGVHKNQALVLVNYGGAEGNEIYQLSEKIIQSVKEKYNITLEREVNIY